MQKLSILLILLAAFLISCQTKVENLATNLNTNYVENIEKIEEIQPLISPTSKEAFNIHSKIGIVDVHSDRTGCLRTKNANLAEKTPISIIISLNEPPQKVLTATVEKKLEESCARYASETGDKNPGENFFYSLILTGNNTIEEDEIFDVGIAVIKPANQIEVQNNLANIDLNEDGKSEFFRRCTGFEGLHFTMWIGKPLKGKRIWHSFYYLDYDTKENCKKKDWKGVDDEAD